MSRHLAATEEDRQQLLQARAALVGQVGMAITPLRPAGRVTVGETEYEAVAEGGVMDQGVAIRIVSASPFTLTVRAMKSCEQPWESAEKTA